jgi:hypothetical protein
MHYIDFITLIFLFFLLQIYLLKNILSWLLLFLSKYDRSISQVFEYFSLFLKLVFHLQVNNEEAPQSFLHEIVTGNHEKCPNESGCFYEKSHIILFYFQSVKHETLE